MLGQSRHIYQILRLVRLMAWKSFGGINRYFLEHSLTALASHVQQINVQLHLLDKMTAQFCCYRWFPLYKKGVKKEKRSKVLKRLQVHRLLLTTRKMGYFQQFWKVSKRNFQLKSNFQILYVQQAASNISNDCQAMNECLSLRTSLQSFCVNKS